MAGVTRQGRCLVSGNKKKTDVVRKKKVSKITPPSNPNETKLIAFRADAELTRLLKTTPNKSEVIVEALRDYFSRDSYVTCTRCKGTGKMKRSRKTK